MPKEKELKKVKGEKRGVAEEDPKRELPRITFTVSDLPELKNWKVGGKYTLEVEVEQVAMSKNEYGFEEEKELKATFKVTKVKASGNPNSKKKDNVEFGNYKNPNRVE